MTAAGAVLWDLDGVLVDSTRYHHEAYREMLTESGRELGFEEFRNLIGLRNETILRRLFGELPAGEGERLGGEGGGGGKPDPEGFLVAAGGLGVAPADCVVLEDAPEGIEGAKAAGMRCVGVATTRPPERLRQAGLGVGSLADPR